MSRQRPENRLYPCHSPPGVVSSETIAGGDVVFLKTLHRSWLACAGATVMMFVSTGLVVNSLSVYLPYLLAEYGLTNAQGSWINTIRCLASLCSMPVVAGYYRRTGLRRGAGLAMALCAGSYVLFGLARGFAGLCAAAVIAGVSYSLGGIVAATIAIDAWFAGSKGTAMGICTAGSGVAAVVMPAILTRLLDTAGVSVTFFAEAGLMLALGLLVVGIFAWETPEQAGLTPYGTAPEADAAPERRGGGMTKGYLLAMLLAMAFIGSVGGPGYSNAAVLFSTQGYDSMAIAWAISLNGLMLIVCKCGFGFITDRIGAYRTNFLFGGLLIGGFVLCLATVTGSGPVIFGAELVLGAGWSICTVGLPVWAGDLAAPEDHAATVQKFQTAYSIGALVFSPVPGILADASGSYLPAYALFTLQSEVILAVLQVTYRHCGAK